MIQTSLFEDDARSLARRPRPRAARAITSNLLVDILGNDEAPRRAQFVVDGRDLSVTVTSNTITLDLAGANGGHGQQITLPPAIIAEITAMIENPTKGNPFA